MQINLSNKTQLNWREKEREKRLQKKTLLNGFKMRRETIEEERKVIFIHIEGKSVFKWDFPVDLRYFLDFSQNYSKNQHIYKFANPPRWMSSNIRHHHHIAQHRTHSNVINFSTLLEKHRKKKFIFLSWFLVCDFKILRNRWRNMKTTLLHLANFTR